MNRLAPLAALFVMVWPQATAGPSHDRSLPAPAGFVSTADLGAKRIQTLIDSATPAERTQLDALDRASSGNAIWLDDRGALTPGGHDALDLVGNAYDDALDPFDYDAIGLFIEAGFLGSGYVGRNDTFQTFDRGLSLSVLRYLHDVHQGRVDPRDVGALIQDRHESIDYARLVFDARHPGGLGALRDALAPRFSQYARLREAFRRYLAYGERVQDVPAVALDHTVRPGDALPIARSLRAELVAYGDLAGDAAMWTSDTYDAALAEGVRHFQRRHGLADDGILGSRTREELAVPFESRLMQIALAMERLRWLPPLDDDRVIAVNIPMFRLWAIDTPDRDVPPFESNVIVGKALTRQTPMLLEDMTSIIFRPYWNVPASILKRELLPIIRRDPAYLVRQGFEIVNGSGDDAPVVEATPAAIASLGVTTRLRQRPGPKNSLGLVKFVFPNSEDVYMHGTPAVDLFQRERRDLSHGCVRVEHSIDLAAWVLDDPAWDRDRVLAAMTAGHDNERVTLAHPIPVVLFYTTAVVSPDDGTVHFAHDWYGRDRALEEKLHATGAGSR